MEGINTKPSILVDKTFTLYFNKIRIGLIVATKMYYDCYFLEKRIKIDKRDKHKMKSILHENYVNYVKELAESLGENLVWQSEVGELKVIKKEGWKILS